MKELIKSLFESKGLTVPEQDYSFLAEQFALLKEYQMTIDDTKLNDFDILLRNVPIKEG